MLKAEYIEQLDNYLYQCYSTTIYSHELIIAKMNYKDGMGISECAEAIYTLRLLRKNIANPEKRSKVSDKEVLRKDKGKKLKHKFLEAVVSGKIGTETDAGIVVTSKEFIAYFKEENTSVYLGSYLSSVVVEPGRYKMLHNKYLFRMGKGQFRVHHDAIVQYKSKHMKS